VSKNTIWGNGFDLIEKYKFWNSNVPLITNYKIKDLKSIMLKFMDLHLHKLKVIDVCINFFFVSLVQFPIDNVIRFFSQSLVFPVKLKFMCFPLKLN
jgi:hypothetical protein